VKKPGKMRRNWRASYCSIVDVLEMLAGEEKERMNMEAITFPDVLHLGANRFRLITDDARSWVHFNTTSGIDVPRVIDITGNSVDVIKQMIADGIRVRRLAA
jgi:hypothetical protein